MNEEQWQIAKQWIVAAGLVVLAATIVLDLSKPGVTTAQVVSLVGVAVGGYAIRQAVEKNILDPAA
jgi:hypothetical protein